MIRSTRNVLRLLRDANPTKASRVTDAAIRVAIRSERIAPPQVLAGRYLWTPEDIRSLVAALGLRCPEDLSEARA